MREEWVKRTGDEFTASMAVAIPKLGPKIQKLAAGASPSA